MRYRASFDATTKLITLGVIVLFLFLLYRYFFISPLINFLSISVAFLFCLILFLSWLYSTYGYEVKDKRFIIHRRKGKIIVPLCDIKSIRVIHKKELGTLIRMWGSGGLFGYYGHFRSTRIGKLKLYTTQRKNLVLVTTVDQDYLLLSPDDLSMIEEIKSGILP